MMNSILRLASCTVLSAAFLLGASAPSHAQAMPIGDGSGTGGSSVAAPTPGVKLTFSLVELPNSSILGFGRLTLAGSGGWVHFDLTSYMFIGGQLLAAGPITGTHNAPPQFTVGGTAFFAVNDNGNAPGADEFIEGAVPAGFGALTIQQIISIIGPPPPFIFRQVESGNFTIH